MSTTRRSTGGAAERPEQLMLLVPNEAPLQFRLDERTRRRGLAQIAEIRRQLAANAERRSFAASSSARTANTSRPRGRAA